MGPCSSAAAGQPYREHAEGYPSVHAAIRFDVRLSSSQQGRMCGFKPPGSAQPPTDASAQPSMRQERLFLNEHIGRTRPFPSAKALLRLVCLVFLPRRFLVELTGFATLR